MSHLRHLTVEQLEGLADMNEGDFEECMEVFDNKDIQLMREIRDDAREELKKLAEMISDRNLDARTMAAKPEANDNGDSKPVAVDDGNLQKALDDCRKAFVDAQKASAKASDAAATAAAERIAAQKAATAEESSAFWRKVEAEATKAADAAAADAADAAELPAKKRKTDPTDDDADDASADPSAKKRKTNPVDDNDA